MVGEVHEVEAAALARASRSASNVAVASPLWIEWTWKSPLYQRRSVDSTTGDERRLRPAPPASRCRGTRHRSSSGRRPRASFALPIDHGPRAGRDRAGQVAARRLVDADDRVVGEAAAPAAKALGAPHAPVEDHVVGAVGVRDLDLDGAGRNDERHVDVVTAGGGDVALVVHRRQHRDDSDETHVRERTHDWASLSTRPTWSTAAWRRALVTRRAGQASSACRRRRSSCRSRSRHRARWRSESSMRALLGREHELLHHPARRGRDAAPHVGRDDAGMHRVGGDAAALEAARELLREQHVRQLRDRVLVETGERLRRRPQRVPVDALARLIVRRARDVDDARRAARLDPIEQQAREQVVTEVIGAERAARSPASSSTRP